KITFYTDLSNVVAKADIIIESIQEAINIKNKFYQQLSDVAPEITIFASNSSTMLPRQLVVATDRHEKFLMLHFANGIWKNNTAEIMKHEHTDMAVFGQVVSFAEDIGMVALPIYKEQPGYILNSLLVPFLDAAEGLLVN